MVTIDQILNEIVKVEDLIYYDGPLVSLFVDEDDKLYIMQWFSENKNNHSWIFYPVSNKKLSLWREEKLRLVDLITSAESVYMFEIDINPFRYSNVRYALLEEILYNFE